MQAPGCPIAPARISCDHDIFLLPSDRNIHQVEQHRPKWSVGDEGTIFCCCCCCCSRCGCGWVRNVCDGRCGSDDCGDCIGHDPSLVVVPQQQLNLNLSFGGDDAVPVCDIHHHRFLTTLAPVPALLMQLLLGETADVHTCA